MSITVSLKRITNLPGRYDRKVELSFRGQCYQSVCLPVFVSYMVSTTVFYLSVYLSVFCLPVCLSVSLPFCLLISNIGSAG